MNEFLDCELSSHPNDRGLSSSPATEELGAELFSLHGDRTFSAASCNSSSLLPKVTAARADWQSYKGRSRRGNSVTDSLLSLLQLAMNPVLLAGTWQLTAV